MEPLTYQELQPPTYLNNKIIGSVGGTPLTIVDAIIANHLMKGNTFLAGKKGSGKTQLLRDIERHWYSGQAISLEGRADLKADEVLKRVNLQKLRTAATSDEILELAANWRYHCLTVDELNRCPEVTQNELLSMMNGYFLHQGQPVILGDGFCAGIATGNLGNGGYVGTFKIDDALADRLHLFLDLDYWKPTDEDKAVIDMRAGNDPRVVLAQLGDISGKIITTHQQLAQQEEPLEVMLIARYLERALDYCEKFPSAECSKDNLREYWPVACTQDNCALKDTLCSRVKSVGERTVKAAKRLAMGLQYVAQLKNPETAEDPLNTMLLATRLMLPYAGVISQNYLLGAGIFNNPNLAARELMKDIEQDLRNQFYDTTDPTKPGPLTRAIAYAHTGTLSKAGYVPDGRWKFAVAHLESINERAKAEHP